jgi:hypothetical protein
MSFKPRVNTAALWKNDKKTDDKHPDYRGDGIIDRALLEELLAKGENPVTISVSLWKNKTKAGQPYLGLSFQKPYDADKKPAQKKIEDEDDDYPF